MLARTPTPKERAKMCGVVSLSGVHGEPLACGFQQGHAGAHSWARLPTWASPIPALLIRCEQLDAASNLEVLKHIKALEETLTRIEARVRD